MSLLLVLLPQPPEHPSFTMRDVLFKQDPGGALVDTNHRQKPFYGVAQGCKFSCGSQQMELTIHIIEGASYKFLLGCPWMVDNQVSLE
jgi:hypothetical protein